MRKGKNKLVAPVLKWVGGKRQLLDVLTPLLPAHMGLYCEPFVGGGALLFDLQPAMALINDSNSELVNVYEVIRDNVQGLIEALHGFTNDADGFYAVREWDRDPKVYRSLSNVVRAARIIYLNKTCYNGLFRVNSAGHFNSPFGNYRNPKIVNEPVLRAVSAYFRSSNIRLTCLDYADAVKPLTRGAFVYLDPPYDPVSDSANFTGYTRGGFGRDEQYRLHGVCVELDRAKHRFMLSNSDTPFIRELYAGFDIRTVRARRAVNSDGTGRGAVNEVVIRNYQ